MDDAALNELLKKIPKVDQILGNPGLEGVLQRYPRWLVRNVVREVLDDKRRLITSAANPRAAEAVELGADRVAAEVESGLKALTDNSLRRVINATGIIIHTNLGRSVLGANAVAALVNAAAAYSNLEYNLDTGQRGLRYTHVERLLRLLSGAEAALAVNNNAAAVFLCLHTFAAGHEVIVSRGELIEIGGSFRIPEVMKTSGAILTEVGTSNKTHLADYERAVSPNTRMILKVHQSNYRIVGFTQEVEIDELVPLCRRHNLILMQDLGSGNLIDLQERGVLNEPTVAEVVKSGPDLVTFSGDKLLGGPQAGIIVGRKPYIDRLQKNHLLRALRVDKFTVAALEATLLEYLVAGDETPEVPTLQMMFTPPGKLKRQARRLADKLSHLADQVEIGVRDVLSQAGGGSLPLQNFPSFAVTLKPKSMSQSTLAEKLRRAQPPVIARIADDELLLDMRTVLPRDVADIVKILTEILSTKG